MLLESEVAKNVVMAFNSTINIKFFDGVVAEWQRRRSAKPHVKVQFFPIPPEFVKRINDLHGD